MKIAFIGVDLMALGVILGSAAKIFPAIAALLGAVWYGFVIYDRLRYGPEVENRTLWRRKQDEINKTKLR